MKLTVEGHGDDGGVALYHEGAFVAELESAEDAESAAAEYSEFFA